MFNSGIFPGYLLFEHPKNNYSLSVSLVGAEAVKINKPWTCLQEKGSPYWETTGKEL